MAHTKGTGLLMVWADVPANKEDEFNRWYNEEHLPERMAIPGFLSGARYEALKGGPKHLAYYELESAAVLETPAYKKVQANPTEWTKRSGPGAIATTFIRNVYTMIHPQAVTPTIADAPMAPVLQIGRMSVPPVVDSAFNTWYNTVYVPNYEKVPGVIRGRRYRCGGHAHLSDALRVRAPQGLGEPRVDGPARRRAGERADAEEHDARARLAGGLRQDGRAEVDHSCAALRTLCILGSSRSRSPSPKRFSPRMQAMMAAPGNRVSQGACCR